MSHAKTNLILDASGTLGEELDFVITTTLVEVTVDVKLASMGTQLETAVDRGTLVDGNTLEPDHDTPLPDELGLEYGG